MSELRVNTVRNQPGSGQADAGQLGVGQTWQNVAGSRTSGVTYTNSTGRTIFVSVTTDQANINNGFRINGLDVARFTTTSSGTIRSTISLPVPAGATYSIVGWSALDSWWELR